jgi:pimeloyl-[acyl-carrier protein] methyl ester esterase
MREMSGLHMEIAGQGEPLVMLHGWGMHGGMWQALAQQLAQEFLVHSVDLPGHGFSVGRDSSRHGAGVGMNSDLRLDSIVEQLSAQFLEPINLCGWSLGGIIAQRWAMREPEKIQQLVLVASTPCFANRPDWECGMPQDTLALFASELENNFAATLRRFLALQVRGSEHERELLSQLRVQLFSRGEPDVDALHGGLAILRDVDLRAALPKIKQPTLLIAGERDKLTPPEASHYMAQQLPDARVVEIKGAAHAPFLSHPEVVIEHMKSFLHEPI